MSGIGLGSGLLLLGFGYIGVGTAKYIYYIFRFRHVMELSWASVFGTISHAAWGLAIWLTAVASFLVWQCVLCSMLYRGLDKLYELIAVCGIWYSRKVCLSSSMQCC